MRCQAHKVHLDGPECPICVAEEEDLGIYPLEKTRFCEKCKQPLVYDEVDTCWTCPNLACNLWDD